MQNSAIWSLLRAAPRLKACRLWSKAACARRCKRPSWRLTAARRNSPRRIQTSTERFGQRLNSSSLGKHGAAPRWESMVAGTLLGKHGAVPYWESMGPAPYWESMGRSPYWGSMGRHPTGKAWDSAPTVRAEPVEVQTVDARTRSAEKSHKSIPVFLSCPHFLQPATLSQSTASVPCHWCSPAKTSSASRSGASSSA